MTNKEIENQEKGDASSAQNVCCTPMETDNSYLPLKSEELPQVFHPWRRYLARLFDITIYNILWSAFLAFAFNVPLTGRSNLGNILDVFIAITIMLFLEPLLLHLFGTTPGKAIFGLKIETADGSLLSYSEGLERTWRVIGIGMGYNIPIYNLVRLWKSYSICNDNETQPWDESISYTIKDTKWYRGLFYIGANAVVLIVLVALVYSQQLPPNRGDLTIEEFVENYNYYVKSFDIDFGNEYLDKNGKWVENDQDGTMYIQIGHSEKPEYNFTLDNGYVSSISFEVEIKNNKNLLSSYDTQMFLASLAFAGAQEEMNLFSKIPTRIAKQISDKTFEDFKFKEAGITFTCDTEYSGYSNYGNTQSDFMFPSENSTENYFSLNFLITK